MKYKNGEIVRIIDILNHFAETKLPSKISFAIMKKQNYFNKEYQDYTKALSRILEVYSDNFVVDKDGKVKSDKYGVPELSDKELHQKMKKEIKELMSVEVDVQRFYIDESVFDYDDSKYDILTPNDMSILMFILCDHNDTTEETKE